MKDNKKILDERFTKGKGGSETITSTTFSNYNLALLNIVVWSIDTGIYTTWHGHENINMGVFMHMVIYNANKNLLALKHALSKVEKKIQ